MWEMKVTWNREKDQHVPFIKDVIFPILKHLLHIRLRSIQAYSCSSSSKMDFVVFCLVVLVSAQLFYHFYSLLNILATRFRREPPPPATTTAATITKSSDQGTPSSKDSWITPLNKLYDTLWWDETRDPRKKGFCLVCNQSLLMLCYCLPSNFNHGWLLLIWAS